MSRDQRAREAVRGRIAPALLLCSGVAAALVPRHADGPPLGHTGGFGEPTCQACHAGTELNLEGGALGVDGLPGHYERGARYTVTIVLQSEDMGRAGFESALRYLDGPRYGQSAGRLEPLDGRTFVRRSDDGVEYITHTFGGSDVESTVVTNWTFAWTAPDDSVAVALHAAANAANGDDSPFADLIYTVVQRVDGASATEAPTSGPRDGGGSAR